MNKKISSYIMTLVLLLTGCVGDAGAVATPLFITATLPATNTPQPPAASTSTLSQSTTEIVQVQPIEAVTTTQLNLRSEPSTAGESLGTVAAFSTVQIIAKESNGKWFQILDSSSSNGKGWIIASYVQVNNPGEIPILDLGPTGLIIQGVNVRTGPGKDFPSLGTLVANDVVPLTGKESSGAWVQINFKGGTGWIASEFTQMQNIEIVPIVAQETLSANDPEPPASNPIQPVAIQLDNDSLNAPIATMKLNPIDASGFQSNGFVSLSAADESDWVQFSTGEKSVSLQVKCPENTLKIDLYEDNTIKTESFATCNEAKTLNITPNKTYTIKLTAITEAQYPIPYSVLIKTIK